MRDTLRAHRTGAITWVVVGGLVMVGMCPTLAHEMAEFPGGPQALGASVEAAAEALRPMRWPAERLDTLGGYLTYHNVILYTFALAIYGVIQGARDIRGAEERGSLEEVLATGHSRGSVVRDRALGFALVLGAVGVGLGAAVAVGMALGGEPDVGGSFIAMTTSALVGFVGYCLGLLCGQLFGSARAASGAGAALLTVLYVATNMGSTLGALEVVTWASPFRYASQSRALVPGHGFDPVATVVLLCLGLLLLGLASWAFRARDYAAPLLDLRRRSDAPTTARPEARIPRRGLGRVWTAQLRRGLPGLGLWAAGAAALVAMLGALQPAVMDMWMSMDFIVAMTGTAGAASVEQAYWSYAGELISPIIAAYVITQASGWVADLAAGRVEMTLSAPVTWSMLVRHRLLAAVVGVCVITVTALACLAGAAVAVGSSLEAAGWGRLLVMGVLFGAALAAVAAVLVAVLRRSAAITALTVVLVASYLLAYLVPVFEWPDWLNRLSIFWAFGHPYMAWPPNSGLAVLLVLALGGTAAAAALAERTPKVA